MSFKSERRDDQGPTAEDEMLRRARARVMGVHPARLEPHDGSEPCAICGVDPGEDHHLATHEANADLTGG